jgi:VIT1/CCC1 family predicted Fe2+/Mn2+ transporter
LARDIGDHEHGTAAIRERLEAGARPGYLRDWIYGAIDGAVTTFAIVAGVVGADLSARIVLILGCANLLADGFSMAAANYSGTKAEHDEAERLRAIEARHIRENPEGERREIREIYRSKGFEGDALDQAVEVTSADEDRWIDFMLVEEYGQPPVLREPMTAALVTFAAFVAAGAMPLLPFLFLQESAAPAALALTGATFFVTGATKSRFSTRHWSRDGLETLAIGLAAAAVAYGVGWLLHGIGG